MTLPIATPTILGCRSVASARERILSAAQDLFAERGFDATPTSQIAARAAVPKGLVRYYFRRKRDLLVALTDRLPREHIDRCVTRSPPGFAGWSMRSAR